VTPAPLQGLTDAQLQTLRRLLAAALAASPELATGDALQFVALAEADAARRAPGRARVRPPEAVAPAASPDVLVAALARAVAAVRLQATSDHDPEVLAQLEQLYAADLEPTPCSGSLLFDTGVRLALLWADERRGEYERALPAGSCDCGAVYKRDQWAAQHEVIYTVTVDGVFDELVASTRGTRGIGAIPRDAYAMNNGGCPSCGRAFKATIARQVDPQTSLIL
jgi:hypothetical protein